jgi:hypothetical protein
MMVQTAGTPPPGALALPIGASLKRQPYANRLGCRPVEAPEQHGAGVTASPGP